jgi:hypothetical protein
MKPLSQRVAQPGAKSSHAFLHVAVTALAVAGAATQVRAQDAVALAIEGWRHQERAGVVYYRCASRNCAAGSVVSYKQQPHRPGLTLADFESHHRGLVRQNSGQGKIREARFIEAKQRQLDGVRVFQIAREVDWTDNTRTFTIEARLIGPARSYSLVSDSPKREWTANNFEGFLRRLADIAALPGK